LEPKEESGAFTETAKYRSTASNIICLYGDQKIGKSCLIAASSWSPSTKLFLHDIDGGWEFAKSIWNQSHPPSNLLLKPVDSYGDLHEGLWNMPEGFGVYVIDTYTKAMNKFKLYVNKPTPSVDAHGATVLPITDWQKIGGKISGLALDYFERWMQVVSSRNAWGIIVCQEKTESYEDGKPSKLVPDLVGKARAEVAGTANFVFHVEYEKKVVGGKVSYERVLRTQNSATCMAADRSGVLDPFEPPDLAAIIRKVELKRFGAPK